MPENPQTWVALTQGFYFAVTGIWPVLSLKTFMAVTGPKVDGWLVKTLGLLIAVVAAVLITASLRNAVSFEVVLLAVGSAAALGGADVWYVAKGRIAKIYLLDAAAEAMLIAAWAVSGAF